MTLRTIFNKPVDRPIEGVIKADDEASLRLEIEEYVLTNEVEKRLESFLDAYNNYEGANGVWVSGFFGSGKSHLLKMLALLLENRQINGVPALDLFLPKCGDNEILRGDLKRAVTIPSKSILFNIDQKADVISKTQIDALLAVFVKVFDEMCGYYGKQGHIAQFERDLDSHGLYEQFKSAYESTAGRTWQKGREQALLEAKNIAKAYARVSGGDEASAMGILDKYRSQYRVSIEDFAEQVHAYIKRQSPDFRLNFFVDEVGQYIAENVKLMTNLQTIAESMATKCRGRAWVIVTAQEDMATVVGEMGKQQGNDFSKIQARFANRMKLTSADVAEVIQKRLLMKTEEGARLLSDIYHAQSNNFKTLFDFADGSQTYRNYQDQDHFIHSYPFIPYQFALFQSAIQNLSLHNAFEGKYSSVGERSMLGVFQQVAIQIGDHEIGQLATFDLMFEGIRTALKSNIQRAIIQAEKHLDSPFAIRLLKALFLVKYMTFSGAGPTVGDFTTFVLMSMRLILPLFVLGVLINQIQQAEASAVRINEIFDAKPVVRDRDDAVSLAAPLSRIEARDLHFSYPGRGRVLCGVDFSLKRGQVLGVAGPTGAGKSSLAKLLLRYYEPESGEILVDGRPLPGITLDAWRGRIGYVAQEPYLFHGTVGENIRLSLPEASDEAVRQAAHMAGADEFISKLPDGYKTLVGDRGVKLSGGQRQRISLARAFLRDPEFLILDEATSSVDTRTEEIIQNNLRELRRDRITLAIAHRLSTIRSCDEIVVLVDGIIVERGTHDSLIAEEGVYAGLWRVQSGG